MAEISEVMTPQTHMYCCMALFLRATGDFQRISQAINSVNDCLSLTLHIYYIINFLIFQIEVLIFDFYWKTFSIYVVSTRC
jgi:hypothetical protein